MKYLFLMLISGMLINSGYKNTSLPVYLVSANYSVCQEGDIVHITDHKNFDITFHEPGFNKWLAKQESITDFYESSLEFENLQYVHEWNRRVAHPEAYDHHLYNQHINYKIIPGKRYGLEVNYKLYQYFRYFELKHESLLLHK
jgi:hypothetical protein